MNKFFSLAILAILIPSSASALVIRHDVQKEKYLTDNAHPALVDMRHEGHGMLIAPEWVVSAAHVIFHDYKDETILIGGKERLIKFIIFHPGYSRPPKGIFQGDAAPGQAYLRGNDDIVLIKLKAPVEDVAPISIYANEDEAGQIVTLYGRGNTGDGVSGQTDNTKGTLRTAQNTLTEPRKQWLHYRFDQGDAALPLEGFHGNGDSGGPAIIRKDGVDYLAGLASWDVYEGDLENFRGSVYGMEASLVRLSYYSDWIRAMMARSADELTDAHYKMGYGK